MIDRATTSQRSPWVFCALVFAIAVPFWALGALVEQGLLRELGVGLPISALALVAPLAAALILTFREKRAAGVVRLLRQVLDLRTVRPGGWFVPTLLLMPAIYALSFGVMSLAGAPLAAPRVSLPTLTILFGIFFIAAACEEAGWTGYALEPLQGRWGALGAGLALGIVWAALHVVPDLQGHQAWGWIAGQRGFSVAFRVLLVWLYNSAGRSVFAATLLHAMDNVSVFTLFPNDDGSAYNPAITAAITALIAALVMSVWRPSRPRPKLA